MNLLHSLRNFLKRKKPADSAIANSDSLVRDDSTTALVAGVAGAVIADALDGKNADVPGDFQSHCCSNDSCAGEGGGGDDD